MKFFALSFFAFTVAAMAQVKVSDLPAASTLGGTEVFPTVQSATTKKATAAQIAEYARSVTASTLAPIANPTFTGTVTIPSGASIADYLSTASAATIYAPLASPTFTGTPTVPGYLTTASAAATYAPLANPTFSGVLTMSGGSNAVRVDVAGVYAGLVQNGINTNKNGFIYTLRFPTTVTGNYTVTLPDGVNGTLAMQSGALGTPSSVTLTNATGLPIATGVSGLGTGIATALAVNVGSAGAPVVNGGVLGTPSSGTGTNITGIPPVNVIGTAAVLGANTFTGLQTFSASSGITCTAGTFTISSNGNILVNPSGGGALVVSGPNMQLSGSLYLSTSLDVILSRESTGRLKIGLDHGSTATNQIIKAHNVTTGTGAKITIGGGTGSVAGGAVALATSATTGALVEHLTVTSSGGIILGASGTPITAVLSAVATKDFDLTAVTVEELTMTVTGAAVGDVVQLGVPTGSVTTTASFSAWVSAANTVTIRCKTQAAGENPASGSFRATVTKH